MREDQGSVVTKNTKYLSKKISCSSILERIGNTPLLKIDRITGGLKKTGCGNLC